MTAEEELWADVPGFEGLYMVSNMGRVKSFPRPGYTLNPAQGKILHPIIQHSGYAHIGLWHRQVCKQSRVHRLVAAAFCPNDDPEHKTQVNHLNENKLDNRAENLEWCTPKHNTNYGMAIARRLYGRQKAVECVGNDGAVVRRFVSQADANSWCGVARNDGHISACCGGRQKTAYGYRWRAIKKEVKSHGR